MGPGKKRLDRFWARVDKSGECWIWQGAISSTGYGVVNHGTTTSAHRWIYQVTNGPLVRGTDVHHTCRTKLCVRPDHLVAIAKAEHAHAHLGETKVRPIAVDKPVITLLNAKSNCELLTEDEFIELIRATMGTKTQKEFAQMIGMTAWSLSNVLRRKKRPGRDLLSRVGFERVVTFEEKQSPKVVA